MSNNGKRILAARQVVGNVIAGYDHLHCVSDLKKAYAQALINVQEELEYEPYVPCVSSLEPNQEDVRKTWQAGGRIPCAPQR